MSDDTTTDDFGEKKGKKGRDGGEGESLVEPVPKDRALFEWLEGLFYSEEQAHPEKLDLCPVSGPRKEKVGTPLETKPFAPDNISPEALKKMPGKSRKPSREQLVILTNRWLNVMQRDCDELRQPQTYAIHAWHFKIDDQPYSRFLKSCRPSGRVARDRFGSSGEGLDEENLSLPDRHSIQILEHQQKMFSLYGGGFEGMLDRFDRLLERAFDRIEKQDSVIQKQNEMMERALSLEAERKERLEWARAKNRAFEKVTDIGLQVLPPLLGSLTGKKTQQPSLEAITLQNFLKLKEEGGSLTKEQCDAAFGIWDGEKLVTPGVLTPEQCGVILSVAFKGMPAEELDKIAPGGPLQFTMEQFGALQQIFSMEQLAPLLILFQNRQSKKGQ